MTPGGRAMLWQDTQPYEPLSTEQMGISARSGPPELLLSPAVSSLQSVLEWLFAFTWPRFTPKVCFPKEVAGHTPVDTISKQDTSCASWGALWKVLQDGLEEIWVEEVGLHGVKLRSPEKSSILQQKQNGLSGECGSGEFLGWCL